MRCLLQQEGSQSRQTDTLELSIAIQVSPTDKKEGVAAQLASRVSYTLGIHAGDKAIAASHLPNPRMLRLDVKIRFD
jgi:hypothetical protein